MTSDTAHCLLTIDVGNSRTKLGLFDVAAPPPRGQLPQPLHSLAVPHADAIPWDAVRDWPPKHAHDLAGGLVAGTNPAGVQRVLADWKRIGWPAPRQISPTFPLPLTIAVDAPEKVGIDRLLNALAANVIRPKGLGTVIVDCGTATTVDAVDASGAFCGGAIMAGFEMAARSLHEYTALLPYVSIEELASEPHAPLGRNTRAALRSGLYWGQVGAVKELAAQLQAALNPESAFQLLLTGGGAPLLQPHFPTAQLYPHLALQGLAVLAVSGGKSA